MEYADGGDLTQKLHGSNSNNNPYQQHHQLLAEQQILNYFVQICLGLKHIHDRKIIHRDIKSENIFLNRSGQIKIGDFGISKNLPSTFANAMTRIGTPYYLR